jgi:hypothetical protein
MDEDALFALADEAAKEAAADAGEDYEIDAEDIFDSSVTRVRNGKSKVFCLANGDFHVCFGTDCQFAVVDRDNQLVCEVTGIVVGMERNDTGDAAWAGRSTGSNNPDDHAGPPPGGWIKRRCMFSASVEAHKMAERLCDDDVVYQPTESEQNARAVERPGIKRGALCVDESPVEDPNKRARASKRDLVSPEALEKLKVEASQIIEKLLSTTRAGASDAAPSKRDPRLQNVEFVRNLALRRYVKRCADGVDCMSVDGVNNVCVQVNEFVKQQRRLASEQHEAQLMTSRRKNVFSGRMRNAVAVHIVAVWRAACLTPHMTADARNSDSFRPFVAGVLYALKRGVFLGDGRCVVPPLEPLAEQLPQLRSTNATAQAKQLHSSSHRGLCTLHRAVSSLSDGAIVSAECADSLNEAVRSAAALQRFVQSNV